MARALRKRNMWTAADLKLLRQRAGKETVHRIAKRLKRTVLAVRWQASTRGIRLAVKRRTT